MSGDQASTEKAAEVVVEFNRVPSILPIQSHVSYGHVGNSAAIFPLQHAGFEVWPIHTIDFSNHTGYGQWRGLMIPAMDVREVIRGTDELDKLDDVDAIISGYQGGSDIADVIIETVALIKQCNPKTAYLCDPVMGNAESGCHVSDNVPLLLHDEVVPAVDVIMPNQSELGYLTDREVGDLESTLATAHVTREMGPEAAPVTGVLCPERKADEVEIFAVNGSGARLVAMPYLPLKRNGPGDITASLFAGNPLRGRDINGGLSVILGDAVASTFELLRVTYESSSGEPELVRAQEAYVRPEQRLKVAKVA